MGHFDLEGLPNDVLRAIQVLVVSDPANARSAHQVSRRWRQVCQQGITQLHLQSSQLQLPWQQQALRSFYNVSKLKMRFLDDKLGPEALASCVQLIPKLSHLTVELSYSFRLDALLPVVSTLTALQELRLKDPRCRSQAHVSPLAALTQLKVLSLSGPNINLANLTTLSALQSLSLCCRYPKNLGQATALSGLEELTLSWLNRLEAFDIKQLAAVSTLRRLELDKVKPVDLASLTAITALKTLSLHPATCETSDVQHLATFTSLQVLRAPHLTEDFHPLTAIIRLQELGLANARVADLSPLTAFKALRKLTLSFHLVERDLTPVASLTTLRELALDCAVIPDLSVLTSLVALSRLDLWGSHLESVSPLAALSGLKELRVEKDWVQDQASLTVLTGVTLLNE